MAWSGKISVGNTVRAGGNLFDAWSQYGSMKTNAKNIGYAGQYQAEMLRKQGFSSASMARAVAAENGLDVDTGSAAMIQDEHIGDAHYNAYMTQSQADYQAREMRRQAKTSLVSGIVGAGAQFFGG